MPLQARAHPAWVYTRNGNNSHLHPGAAHNFTEEVLKEQIRQLFGPVVIPELPKKVVPFCMNNIRPHILASMLDCDAWGIKVEWQPPH